MANSFGINVNLTGPFFDRPPDMDRVIEKALRASALHLESKVKDNITPFTRTGRLRSSIQHKVQGRSAFVGTRVVYARPVEYGHHSFRGHHYMERAFKSEERRVRDIFQEQIRRELG